MIVVVCTQSRTMFVALFLIFVVVAFATGKFSLVLIGTIFILIIKYLVHTPYLDLLFDSNKLSQTHSVTGRLDGWANLMTMIKQQPWLGFGGYKEYFYLTQTYPENEYILAWFRYGIVYLILFCGMMIISVIMGILSAQKKIFGGYFMLGTNLTLLISSISNTPFNNPRLFVFYSLVQAIYSASLLYSLPKEVQT
jgi:O-antigen ligase